MKSDPTRGLPFVAIIINCYDRDSRFETTGGVCMNTIPTFRIPLVLFFIRRWRVAVMTAGKTTTFEFFISFLKLLVCKGIISFTEVQIFLTNLWTLACLSWPAFPRGLVIVGLYLSSSKNKSSRFVLQDHFSLVMMDQLRSVKVRILNHHITLFSGIICPLSKPHSTNQCILILACRGIFAGDRRVRQNDLRLRIRAGTYWL